MLRFATKEEGRAHRLIHPDPMELALKKNADKKKKYVY